MSKFNQSVNTEVVTTNEEELVMVEGMFEEVVGMFGEEVETVAVQQEEVAVVEETVKSNNPAVEEIRAQIKEISAKFTREDFKKAVESDDKEFIKSYLEGLSQIDVLEKQLIKILENKTIVSEELTMEKENKGLGIVVETGAVELGYEQIASMIGKKKSFTLISKHQTMEIAAKLIDYTQYSAQGFTFSKEGTILPIVTGVAKSLDKIVLPGIGSINTGSGSKVVNNKIDGVFVIDASSDHGRYVAGQISEYGAWLDKDGNLYFRKFSMTEGYQLIDARTNASITEVERQELGLVKYKMFGGTAAAFRRHSYIVVREGLMSSMKEMFNNRYNNAYDICLKGQEGSRKDQSKMGRMFHDFTPQTTIGQLGNYAVYTGKFMNGGNDGQSFVNAAFVREAFTTAIYNKLSMLLNIPIDKVIGNSLQGRPATAKEQSSIAASSFINNMINVEKQNGASMIIVEKSELNAEKSKELFAMPNTIIMVVDSKAEFALGKDRIDWVADRNGIKLEFDLSQPVDFYMLKTIKSTGRATLNGQVLSKFIHLQGGMDYVRKIMNKYIAKSLSSIEELIAQGEGFVTEKQLGSSDIDGTIKKLFMSTVTNHFPNIEKRYLNNLWNEMSKTISKLRFEVEGDYLTVEADPTRLQGGKSDILAINEVFINNPRLAEKVKKMLLIKYPSVHVREFLIGLVVTAEDIKNRIAAKVLSGEMTLAQGRALETYYFTASEAKLIISSDDSLKGMLAGLDFDTDAIMAFYDEELVELVEKNSSPLMVIIEGLKSNDNNTYDLSVEGYGKLVQNNISGEGMSIGMITHISEIFSSLYAFGREKAAKMLQRAFRKSSGSEDYVALPRDTHESGYEVVTVNEDNAMRVINDLVNLTKITEQNVFLIIEDLIAICRYVQETSIDFPKTGVNTLVNIALEVLVKDEEGRAKVKNLKSVWHCPIANNRIMNEEESFKGLKPKQVEAKKKANKNVGGLVVNYDYKRNEDMNAYMDNVLHQLREEGLAKAKAEIVSRLEEINSRGFSKLVREQYEGFMAKHKYKDMFKSWKGMYNDIQSEYVTSITDFYDAETGEVIAVSDSVVEYARTVRKQKIDALAATIRITTADMTLVERGHAMMAMSIVSNQTGKLRTDLGTGFYTVLPLELFAMFEAISKNMTGKSAGFVAKEIFVNENYNTGDTVVENGTKVVFDEVGNTSFNAILPDTELFGEYVVRQLKGKYFACKSISSVITEKQDEINTELEEANLVLSINFHEDKHKVYEAIKGQEQLIVTASRENGDYVRNAAGEPIAHLVLPKGDSFLAKRLNGRLFDVVSAELREGKDGYVSIVVVVSGGKNIERSYTRPSGLVTAPKVANLDISVSDDVVVEQYADTDDMFAF